MPEAILEAPAAPPSAPAAPPTPTAPTPPARTAPTTNFPTQPARGEVAKGVFERLEKLGATPETPPARPAAKVAPKAAAAIAPPEIDKPPTPEKPPEKPSDNSNTAAPPAAPADRAKVNPWRLVDDWKAKTAQAEAKIAELQKGSPNPEALKSLNDKLTKAEAKVKEYEDEIRHQDYKRHPEFKEKYDVPYEKAWVRSMKEMKELTVADAAGNERPVTADDMLELVNLPLKQAKVRANEMFGEFGEYAMERRNSIKQLYDAKTEAEMDARKNGETWQKEQTATQQRQQKEIHDFVADTWAKANEAATKDTRYGAHFVPVDGDEIGNQKLAKGFDLVDRAFAENPADPRHTPEQRASIIKRHTAVRNRAAAFGRLVHKLNEATAAKTALEKKLAGYETTAPTTEGRETASAAGATTSLKATLMDKLDALGRTS